MQTLVTLVLNFGRAAFGLVAQIRQPARQFGFRVLSKDRRRVFENMTLAGLNPTDEVKKSFP